VITDYDNGCDGQRGACGEADDRILDAPCIDESKIQAMVDEFNAQSETTEVKLSVLPWMTARADQAGRSVRLGPDVFYWAPDWMLPWWTPGCFCLWMRTGIPGRIDQFSSMIDASIVDGHLYAAPVNYESYIMYYWTDIWQSMAMMNCRIPGKK
jgi:maltose-binding protein MalE